ncbi:MAG: hypothetical protein E7522_11300 [Ruminococcaceae bacterium]|nr:hypothetical protein [Oscillospiraceae bacterium]
METKDWIIMLVPILINGVFLFVFQQVMTQKIKKTEKKTDYRQGVLTEFLSLMQSVYDNIKNIAWALKPNSDDFAEHWNSFVLQIQNINSFYNTHKPTLSSLEKPYEKCIEGYKRLDWILSKYVAENNGSEIFRAQVSEEFSAVYYELEELLKKCLSECEEEILKFK